MAQMEKQINIKKVTRFDIVRTKMLSARHKSTAFTFGGLICSTAPIK
jgi:hypothetical protein